MYILAKTLLMAASIVIGVSAFLSDLWGLYLILGCFCFFYQCVSALERISETDEIESARGNTK